MDSEFIEYTRPSFRCLLPAGGRVKNHFPYLRCEYPEGGFLSAVSVFRLAADARQAMPHLFSRHDVTREGPLDGHPDIMEFRHSLPIDGYAKRFPDGRISYWDFFFTAGGCDFKAAIEGTEAIYGHAEVWLSVVSSVNFDPDLFLQNIRSKADRYGEQRQRMSEKFLECGFKEYSRYGLECSYPDILSLKGDLPGFWLNRKGKYWQTVFTSIVPENSQSWDNPQQTGRVLRSGEAADLPGWQEAVSENFVKGSGKTITTWSLYGRMSGELFHIDITDELDFSVTEPVWRRMLLSLSYDPAGKGTARPGTARTAKPPAVPRGTALDAAGARKLARLLRAASRISEEAAAAWDTPDPDPEDMKFTLPDWPWPAGRAEQLQREYAAAHGLPERADLALAAQFPASFVLIPPGRFVMGGWMTIDARGNLRPHSAGAGKGPRKADITALIYAVRIGRITRPFYLMTTPVTQEMWQTVMGSNPSVFQGEPDSLFRPAENMTVQEVSEAFLPAVQKRLFAGSGLEIRLPDESEWEYAYRAGSAAAFPGGTPSVRTVHCSGLRSLASVQGTGQAKNTATAPVASYPPSPFGLYDMAGNVSEMCRDVFAIFRTADDRMMQGRLLAAAGLGPDTLPGEDLVPESRAIRGGSYASDDADCCSFGNRPTGITLREPSVGLRLVLTLAD